MNNKTVIPVFYSCDDNFVKYTIVSIRSLIQNASRNYEYVIHILCTDICEEMKAAAYQQAEEGFEIRFDDVTKHLKAISEKLPLRDYYSKTTYYRIFIAEMFPEYEKAIYIDSDTIVLGDISELYCRELGDNYVAAANEQVMLQVDTYGEYVEQVLGLNRQFYFNAGLLLINCRKFRENQLLAQFIGLLHQYNFVVTQDEDYLNLLCSGHVLWLEPKWNVEVFGTIACEESEICILHYIMVSKPWHYEDCRFSSQFWNYAEKTQIYDKVREVLETYSEEEREEDRISADRLLLTAKAEIAREDNYRKLRESGRLQACDRLLVLDKIAQLEREGRFDVDAEEDPPTIELLPDQVDYLQKKVSSRLKSRLTFMIARRFLNRIIENKQMIVKDILGIEHFSNLKSGAIITCNHFNAFDSFAIQMTYEAARHKKRKFYRVIREGNYTNFPGFYGMLMRNCNTFPLSSNKETMKKFMKSLDTVLQEGNFVLIYPEQSLWWNYRKPKPLKKGAYTFAARNNVPVLPCFITMQDSDVLGEDGFYIQEYTIHVSEPIYPDSHKSRAENVEYMRRKNYELWKEIYETTYQEPLVYSCDAKNMDSREDYEKMA